MTDTVETDTVETDTVELLLELFCDEIPARMQKQASEDLVRGLVEAFTLWKLSFEGVQSYVTPRRLTIVVTGMARRTTEVRENRRGPRVDAPDKATEGFMRSNGISSRDQMNRCVEGKDTFYFYELLTPSRTAEVVVNDTVFFIIREFPWPKSMRWGAASERMDSTRWVRPLQNILCVLGGKALPVPVNERLKSNNNTRGHRFMGGEPFSVNNFADYKQKLLEHHVILDSTERENRIWEQATALATQAGLTLVADKGLLAENAGLTEWPVPLLGTFDAAFLEVPPEVIQLTMRTNQKYFALRDKHDKLSNHFICVANIEATDGGATIVAGNQKVLAARLSDAKFFYEQDLKVPLDDPTRTEKLEQIVFHEKLGTVAKKVKRVEFLSLCLCEEKTVDANPKLTEQAARLCKNDLVTSMVGEFPELQGIMGGYYASAQKLPQDVTNAIRDHYKPAGQNDTVPTAPVTAAVALADRLDTLASFFFIGLAPTGSSDPFALRRAALAVILIILKNKLRLPLKAIISSHCVIISVDKAMLELGPELEEKFSLDKIEEHSDKLFKKHGEPAIANLLNFFMDRLKVQQREAGVPHDYIDAVFSLGGEDDIVRLLARVQALQAFLKTDDGTNLLAGYRRAVNILKIEEKKDNTSYNGAVNTGSFVQDEERALQRAIEQATESAAKAVHDENFTAAMATLATLRAPIDAFFDAVRVNDPAHRINRLNMLAAIRTAVHTVADFSKIET